MAVCFDVVGSCAPKCTKVGFHILIVLDKNCPVFLDTSSNPLDVRCDVKEDSMSSASAPSVCTGLSFRLAPCGRLFPLYLPQTSF